MNEAEKLVKELTISLMRKGFTLSDIKNTFYKQLKTREFNKMIECVYNANKTFIEILEW